MPLWMFTVLHHARPASLRTRGRAANPGAAANGHNPSHERMSRLSTITMSLRPSSSHITIATRVGAVTSGVGKEIRSFDSDAPQCLLMSYGNRVGPHSVRLPKTPKHRV